MKSTMKAITLVTIIISSLTMIGCEADNVLAPASSAVVVIDTAPPATPTGLAAMATENNHVKLAWDANVTDADLHGFMVYRVIWGDHYPMLTLPIQENTWVDDNPVNIACTYVVTALDGSGNESAWAAINYFGPEVNTRHRMD